MAKILLLVHLEISLRIKSKWFERYDCEA